MTGVRVPIRILLPIALVVLLAGPASAASFDLERLLDDLAPADGVLASEYVETRASGLLTEEVQVHGHIEYRSPGELEKTEQRDDEERTVTIREGTVRLETAEETRTFPLTRSRQLTALMDLLEAVATGDADLLREAFESDLDGDPDAWRLRLRARRGGSGSGEGADARPLRLEVTGDDIGIEYIRLESSEAGRLTLELLRDADA